MNTKRLLIPVLVVGGVLATSGLAHAKGPSRVRITGPGLAEPLVVKGTDGLAWPQMTGFYNQTGEQPPPDEARLGPRYIARVSSGEETLIQHLYPYAEDGPYVYTPPEQNFAGAPEGWNHTGTDLLEALIRAGLPREPPSVSSGVEVPAIPPARNPSSAVWIVLMLTLILMGVLWVARQRTSRPVPDR